MYDFPNTICDFTPIRFYLYEKSTRTA